MERMNEDQLRVQREMTENFELAKTLDQVEKKASPGRAEISSINSSKKNLERFSEKWVDMPNHL